MPILSAAITALPGPISINTVVPMNSAPKARTSASSAGSADEDSGMGSSFEPAAAITPVAPPSRARPKRTSPFDADTGTIGQTPPAWRERAMADLLALSTRIIDSGVVDEPVNRVTQELSEVGDGIAVVESFSHVVLFRTADGVVAFDTSGAMSGGACVESLRRWTGDPVSHVVYTHGHVDHVGGSGAFVADADAHGRPRPVFLAHENVPVRFDRYERTNGWNLAINQRQFGWLPRRSGLGIGAAG